MKFQRNSSVMLRRSLVLVLLTIASSIFAIGCGQTTDQVSDSKTVPDIQVQEGTQAKLPTAPDFTLPAANLNNTEISLSQFQGDKPVVIVFYRAYW